MTQIKSKLLEKLKSFQLTIFCLTFSAFKITEEKLKDCETPSNRTRTILQQIQKRGRYEIFWVFSFVLFHFRQKSYSVVGSWVAPMMNGGRLVQLALQQMFLASPSDHSFLINPFALNIIKLCSIILRSAILQNFVNILNTELLCYMSM